MKGKYVYSFSDDCFNSDEYDSPEEAMEAARQEQEGCACPSTDVYIGIIGDKWKPSIEADGIIDMLQEDAYEATGDEDYLDGVNKQQREELTAMLTDAFNRWAKKHGCEATSSPVEDIKEYKL